MPNYALDAVVTVGSTYTDASQLSAEFQAHGLLSASALPSPVLTLTNGGGSYYFKHLGNGRFNFHCTTYPDGFRGAVVLKYGGQVVAAISINPQEAENVDVPISTVADSVLAVTGNGTVTVDQDYGGTDHYRITDENGAGVELAVILFYAAEDYDAGHTGTAFVVAKTVTAESGRWQWPVLLNPGDYTLVISRDGRLPQTAALTVA